MKKVFLALAVVFVLGQPLVVQAMKRKREVAATEREEREKTARSVSFAEDSLVSAYDVKPDYRYEAGDFYVSRPNDDYIQGLIDIVVYWMNQLIKGEPIDLEAIGNNEVASALRLLGKRLKVPMSQNEKIKSEFEEIEEQLEIQERDGNRIIKFGIFAEEIEPYNKNVNNQEVRKRLEDVLNSISTALVSIKNEMTNNAIVNSFGQVAELYMHWVNQYNKQNEKIDPSLVSGRTVLKVISGFRDMLDTVGGSSPELVKNKQRFDVAIKDLIPLLQAHPAGDSQALGDKLTEMKNILEDMKPELRQCMCS
ncbi:MAG TPA: hypothetical protein QGF02_01415 [Candidatus Babeliales bacterium]|nr:hypothetical protein [Candidatus Babeliales bacterium]